MDHQHTTTELHKKLVEKWLFLNRKFFTQKPTGEENLSDPLFSNTCITGTDIEHRYSWKIGEKIHLWYWIHLYFSVKTIVKQLIEGTHYLPSWSFPSMPSWTSLCCSEHKIRFSLSSWLSIFTSDIKKLPYIDFASGPMNHQVVMRGSPQARGFPSWGVGCPYLSPAGGFVIKLLTCYEKSYIYIFRDLIYNW